MHSFSLYSHSVAQTFIHLITVALSPSHHPPLRLVARGVVGSCQYLLDWTNQVGGWRGSSHLAWGSAGNKGREKKKNLDVSPGPAANGQG